MWRTDSLEKNLILGKIEGGRRKGQRGWDGWMASLTQWTWVWVSSGSQWWTGKSGVLQSMGSQRVGQDWVTELNWWSRIISPSYNSDSYLQSLFFLFAIQSNIHRVQGLEHGHFGGAITAYYRYLSEGILSLNGKTLYGTQPLFLYQFFQFQGMA